jgi:FkbM family methyltransferase
MNIKKRILFHVKQNPFTQKIFVFLVNLCGKSKRNTEFESRYNSVVRGGEIILFVSNFSSEYYVDPRSHLALRVISNKSYESDLVLLIQKFWNGGSIVNIGANIGFWAVALPRVLKDVDKVIAIEPNPNAFRLLKKNITHNSLENTVFPLQILISNDTKEVEMETIAGMSEYSSIGSIFHPAVAHLPKEKLLLNSLPLDAVPEIINSVGEFKLLFVDVEGAEYLVFQGSEKFIQKNRPVVIFECSDNMLSAFNNTVKQITDFWKKLDYTLINISTMKPVKNERFYYDGEIIGIPNEDYEVSMLKMSSLR